MPILSALKKFKKSWDTYQPLIEVKIFRGNILHNLNAFQNAYPKFRFAPVLKSNAYGHGLVEVASILDEYNQVTLIRPSMHRDTFSQREKGEQPIPFFMVDSLFEARALRNENIKTPILVLGYTTTANINSCKLKNTAFGIISLEQLKKIAANVKLPTNFHLKIDTGMHRQGLMPEELDEAISIIKLNDKINIEGICSHLADADGNNKNFTEKQIELWNNISANLEKQLGPIKFKHLSNTAGAAYEKDINANVSRLGIGLYGFNVSPFAKLNLKPALEMESIISSVRQIKAAEKVGYGITFTAPREIKVATVPAGYTEGVDRRLSNVGAMTIDDINCPIVGRVSMNITSVDVSNVADVKLEQKITIISKNPSDPNSIENIAKLCNTIPYEILVHIPSSLRRIVV